MRKDERCRRGDGVAGCEKIGWRVEEGTQKADPAANNPPVAVPKPKPEARQ